MNGFANPEKVLKELKLKDDMIAADFGCGAGSWTTPLAKIVEDGKVLAVDVLEESLSALQGKAKAENIENIEFILADLEKDSKIESDSCDLVLMTDLLFQVEDLDSVLEHGEKALKKGGKILIVDWKKDVALGPKEGRILPEEIKQACQKLGLNLIKELDAGIYHFALIFQK